MAASTRLTITKAALQALVAEAVAEALAAQAPVKAAPAKAKAATPFMVRLRAKQAAKVPCAIAEHAGHCNRRFPANGEGLTNHVARIV